MQMRLNILRTGTVVLTAAVLFIIGGGCERQSQKSGEELLQQALDSLTGKTADWRTAMALSYKAVKKNPNDANAHIMLALSLEQCARRDSALDEIKKATELDPKNFMALYTKGRMLLENEHFEDAIGPLREANKIRPDNPNVLILHGKCAMFMGLYPESLGCYKILAKNSAYRDRPEIYNESAVIVLKSSGKNTQAALKLFEMALKKAPTNHIVILNIAVLLDRYLKKPSEALKFYQRYLEVTLSNPELKSKRAAINQRMQELRNGSL